MNDYGSSVSITWEELLGRPLTEKDLCDACKRPLGINVTSQGDKAWHSGCYSLIKDGFTTIGDFVRGFLHRSTLSVDPFARNSRLATHRNDMNPNTCAEHHLDAVAFLEWLATTGVKFDLALLDPPYSPRQITECYAEAGLKAGMQDTQNAALYARTRAALLPILTNDAIVLSFGWNSSGMGSGLGFEQTDLLLVCHGAAHNDTICVAERRVQASLLAA